MKKIFTFFMLLWLVVPISAQTSLTVAEDFTVTDLDGNSFNLFNTLNSSKFVVIDFFYCTCVPCQQNTPKVQFAFQYFGCNTSNVVFISMDTGDDNAACRIFEENFQNLPGNKFPSVSGDEGGGTAICNTYGINAYPTVILIAPDKNIVERDIWPIADGEYLASVIESQGGIPADCSAVGIEEMKQNVFTGFSSIFPNPVNNVFNMQIDVVEDAFISFEVYNLLGEKIIEVPSNEYVKGTHTIQLPVENIANGTYLVNLLTDKMQRDVCKMFVVK
jgi:hypothetical protein